MWCWGFPSGFAVKNPAANAGNKVQPWVRKVRWRRKWQPTAVFLPGKPHGQRRPEGHSPWGHKEAGTTEHTRTMWQCTFPGKPTRFSKQDLRSSALLHFNISTQNVGHLSEPPLTLLI